VEAGSYGEVLGMGKDETTTEELFGDLLRWAFRWSVTTMSERLHGAARGLRRSFQSGCFISLRWSSEYDSARCASNRDVRIGFDADSHYALFEGHKNWFPEVLGSSKLGLRVGERRIVWNEGASFEADEEYHGVRHLQFVQRDLEWGCRLRDE
jgi:hypothetical protein